MEKTLFWWGGDIVGGGGAKESQGLQPGLFCLSSRQSPFLSSLLGAVQSAAWPLIGWGWCVCGEAPQ